MINILGGFLSPDGDRLVEGVVYDLDAAALWVRRSIWLRHLIETDVAGRPLAPAPVPPPSALPSRLEDLRGGLGDDGWTEWLLFG